MSKNLTTVTLGHHKSSAAPFDRRRTVNYYIVIEFRR